MRCGRVPRRQTSEDGGGALASAGGTSRFLAAPRMSREGLRKGCAAQNDIKVHVVLSEAKDLEGRDAVWAGASPTNERGRRRGSRVRGRHIEIPRRSADVEGGATQGVRGSE